MVIRGISEYYKLGKDFSYENYISAFNKVKDIDILVEMIDGYLLKIDNFPLADILSIDNKNLKKAFGDYMWLKGFRRDWTKEELQLMKDKGFLDSLKALQKRLMQIRCNVKLLPFLSSITGIYDKNLIILLAENNLLHELYKETNNKEIVEYLLDNLPNFKIYMNIKTYLSMEDRNKLLDNIVNYFITFRKEIDLKYYDSYDLTYICSKLLQKNCLSSKYAFMFLELGYYDECNKKVLINIIKKGEISIIYKALISETINLNIVEKESLEKILKDSNNFEYNFYYSLKINEKAIIEKFGSYLNLKMFLLSSNIFNDKEESNKIVEYLNVKIGNDEKMLYSELESIVFKDDSVILNEGYKKK